MDTIFIVYSVRAQQQSSFSYNSTFLRKILSFLLLSGDQCGMHKSPQHGYFGAVHMMLCGCWGTTVMSYLWAIYFMVDHKQEHYSTDRLHNNGPIVHLLPVRGMLTQGS